MKINHQPNKLSYKPEAGWVLHRRYGKIIVTLIFMFCGVEFFNISHNQEQEMLVLEYKDSIVKLRQANEALLLNSNENKKPHRAVINPENEP